MRLSYIGSERRLEIVQFEKKFLFILFIDKYNKNLKRHYVSTHKKCKGWSIYNFWRTLLRLWLIDEEMSVQKEWQIKVKQKKPFKITKTYFPSRKNSELLSEDVISHLA